MSGGLPDFFHPQYGTTVLIDGSCIDRYKPRTSLKFHSSPLKLVRAPKRKIHLKQPLIFEYKFAVSFREDINLKHLTFSQPPGFSVQMFLRIINVCTALWPAANPYETQLTGPPVLQQPQQLPESKV